MSLLVFEFFEFLSYCVIVFLSGNKAMTYELGKLKN